MQFILQRLLYYSLLIHNSLKLIIKRFHPIELDLPRITHILALFLYYLLCKLLIIETFYLRFLKAISTATSRF
jgi:hypothetical protein